MQIYKARYHVFKKKLNVFKHDEYSHKKFDHGKNIFEPVADGICINIAIVKNCTIANQLNYKFS